MVRAAMMVLILASMITSPHRPATASSRLSAYVRSQVVHAHFAGVVVVARHGSVLLDRGYGDAVPGVPNAPSTQFRLASLSKQVTAAAILRLRDFDRLQLQSHLCRWVPRCPAAWKPITVLQLLTHTSGIQNPLTTPAFRRAMLLPTSRNMLAAYETNPLASRPGTRFLYSYVDYDLLGYVIERVTHQPYPQALRDLLLHPLHMTGIVYPFARAMPRHPATGEEGGTRYPIPPLPFMWEAGAGLVGNASDLLRFDEAIRHGNLLTPASKRDLLKPWVHVRPTQPWEQGRPGLRYGLGWYLQSHHQHPYAWHLGLVPGFSSYNAIDLKNDVMVIVLSNHGGELVVTMGTRLAALAG